VLRFLNRLEQRSHNQAGKFKKNVRRPMKRYYLLLPSIIAFIPEYGMWEV